MVTLGIRYCFNSYSSIVSDLLWISDSTLEFFGPSLVFGAEKRVKLLLASSFLFCFFFPNMSCLFTVVCHGECGKN